MVRRTWLEHGLIASCCSFVWTFWNPFVALPTLMIQYFNAAIPEVVSMSQSALQPREFHHHLQSFNLSPPLVPASFTPNMNSAFPHTHRYRAADHLVPGRKEKEKRKKKKRTSAKYSHARIHRARSGNSTPPSPVALIRQPPPPRARSGNSTPPPPVAIIRQPPHRDRATAPPPPLRQRYAIRLDAVRGKNLQHKNGPWHKKGWVRVQSGQTWNQCTTPWDRADSTGLRPPHSNMKPG